MMETIQSQDKKTRLELRGDTLWAYSNSPMQMTTTTFTQEGQTETVQPIQEVIPGYDESLFYATWDGKDWDADVNCGVQRWWGRLSARKFNDGLRRLGFTEAQIKQAITGARKAARR